MTWEISNPPLLIQNYSLRRFNSADLEAVININRICLPENYAAYFFMDTFNTLPDGFIVAESQERVVGYIMCRLEHGFSDLKRLRFAKKAHIISVAVMPDHRKLGIGTALVEQATSALTALNADECFLEVRTTNEPAIILYRKLGYQVTRTIPRYYFDGSDAYVMTRSLP
jgi:ribosomal-protein-alanine N-acetyltransferase